jgi:UDP-N-acetylmuramate dehydrogenase
MSWRDRLPETRGRLLRDQPLGPLTWLRVGGPADVLFMPADQDDLAGFLAALDPAVPAMTLGVGSNLLVRDGGIDGVIVRLGKAFAAVEPEGEARLSAGAAALDSAVARAAARAGLAGLEFLAGVPGSIGGAVAMNAGCYGAETKDVLVGAAGLDRRGRPVAFSDPAAFTYRHGWGAEDGVVVTRALFQGRPDEPAAVEARIAEITARREQSQPIREKTGGSTFKNPPGHSAWKLVDAAGWRGRPYGGAMFSPLHANFLINGGEATAADLEGLGDTVRTEVREKLGVALEWEIKRIGRSL